MTLKQSSYFSFAVRDSDKHISNPEEYSDSEDEGDNRRDNHVPKESRRKKRKTTATPVEKMVTNGVENTEETKPPKMVKESNPSTSPVEEKEKAKSSTEGTPNEGSPQTVANPTTEMTTEPTPEQEASRKR